MIRFGHDYDSTCMKMDEMLASVAELVKKFAVIYLVDITEVPCFNIMYELTDPCSLMFFFRNKLVQIDFGTGENHKMNFTVKTKKEFLTICELVYAGASKGVPLVKSIINYASHLSRGNKIE